MKRMLTVVAQFLVLVIIAIPACADTFTNKATGDVVKGKLMGTGKKDGTEVYIVKGEDGTSRSLPKDEWERQPDAPATAPGAGGAKPKAGNEIAVDFGGGKTAKSQVMEVVAEGTGVDPEKAKLAAFSTAIEKAVGLLVDSESVVKNDQLIRDQVLTFSRGYVESFDVVKEWEQDGLQHCRIRARVAREKLVEKLKAEKIALRPLDGEREVVQVKQENEAEKNAAEMLRKALADYDPMRFVKVEIVGKPERKEKDETHAKIQITVRLSPDLNKWDTFQPGIARVLDKISTKQAVYTVDHRNDSMWGGYYLWPSNDKGEEVSKRVKGEGILVHLLKSKSPTAVRTEWKLYRVPEPVRGVLSDLAQRRYRSRVAMLAQDDSILAEVTRDLSAGFKAFDDSRGLADTVCAIQFPWEPGSGDRRQYRISPLITVRPVWPAPDEHGIYTPSVTFTETMDIELSKLENVTKCAAYIEEVRAK
jgi:hypothetical protein